MIAVLNVESQRETLTEGCAQVVLQKDGGLSGTDVRKKGRP